MRLKMFKNLILVIFTVMVFSISPSVSYAKDDAHEGHDHSSHDHSSHGSSDKSSISMVDLKCTLIL